MANRILDMINQKYVGYHPLMAITDLAHNFEADMRLQFDCHKEIAKYVEATQRSIEIHNSDGEGLICLNIVIDEDED
jgi:hypothetical protein